MRRGRKLWRAVELISSARELALEKRRYTWQVAVPNTFYLDAENADIRISARNGEELAATVELPVALAWRLRTEQDAAGVYIIARRKPLLGSVGRARFDISLPRGLHISLKLEKCRLCLDNMYQSLDLPPPALERR